MARSVAQTYAAPLSIVFGLVAASAVLFQGDVRTPAGSFARAVDGLSISIPTTAPVENQSSAPAPTQAPDQMTGVASWYGLHWQGRKTASGKRFNVHKLTAAHRSLPLNTRVRVTNTENGKSVVVVINDRGPYVNGRVIDLSTAAARQLGMVKEGVVPVRIDIVSEPEPAAAGQEKSPANLLAGLRSSNRADQTE